MKLIDIIEVFIAGDWGEETYSKETPCAVTCVRGADIIPISEYDFSAIPVRYINQQAYAKKCLQVGDIIIEKSGGSPTQSTGRVSLVSQELLDHAGAVICSNFCTAFRVKKGWIPLYVYYYLQFIYNLGAFFNFEGKTSGIKNLQLDAAFAAIPIEDISESIQNDIVAILQGLERKIAINRQINQNLEAVIADVMGYKFLSNAETLPKRFIGDIASIKAGGDCPQEWSKYKTKDCQIPIYSNGTENEGLYGYTKEPTILKRGITVAARGTIGYCTMRNGGYVPIIRLLAVTPNDIGGDVYLHQIFNRIKFRNDGSIQQQLTVPSLASIEIPYPNASTLKAFANITYPLIEKIKQNKIQIEELTKQRDELLPLLMNGQVSVNSDLAASYIIYKNKIIRIMKENIIQAIVAEMQRDLDCRQMARLKAVLTSELHNVEIIEKSDCATQQTQENEHLLNSFISAKKIEGCSDKTLTYYRNTIERLLVTLSLAICHITTTDIRTYLSDYQEEHQSSKVTIDNMRRIFSSFFAWLEDEDYIAKSPVRRIHKVKTDSLVKEVLSDEQLEQLRDSCTNKRDLAIIDILASTGIRVGELVKLNREDIDFHERQCVVFGKGNKERIVYFNARTKLHLQQYLNERTDDNPALFVSLHSPHTRLTISGVEIRIRKLGQSLSMPKVHPHKFRRTLATMAIDKGMPIEQVQRLLGHVRIDTTLHYAIVNQNNVKLAHKKYLG